MSSVDISNSHSEEISRYEHRRKNVGVKATVLYGYDADSDSYYPITATESPDGSFGIRTAPVAYNNFLFDPNDDVPTYIGKNMSLSASVNDTTWVIYKFTYSGNSVTQIQKTTGAWSDRASLF